MGAKRRRYTREFKLEALRLMQQPGVTATAVAEQLGINPETVYRWKKELQEDPTQSFPGHGNLKARDKEIEELRRENARLTAENTFLKKVSAYFAKDKK